MRSRRERFAVAGLCSLFAVLALACQLSSTPAALEDTPENRAAQIERYFQVQPPQTMFDDIAQKMSERMPEDQRARFIDLMTRHFDLAKLMTAMSDSMMKNFTAEEIRALADFYGSPIGRSAMAKFGNYMADVMPAVQTEIMAAVGKVQSELSASASAPPAPAVPPAQ